MTEDDNTLLKIAKESFYEEDKLDIKIVQLKDSIIYSQKILKLLENKRNNINKRRNYPTILRNILIFQLT